MAVVEWGNRPIVTIMKYFREVYIEWHDDPASQAFSVGDTVEIQVAFKWHDPYGGWVSFLVWVETYDPTSNTWTTIVNRDHLYSSPESHTTGSRVRSYHVPVAHNLQIFRVKVSSTWGRSADYLDENDWYNNRQFTAYVQHFGDFSLDYVPMTILYSPPGQDMYNALTQSSEYGTVLSFGFTEEVGTKSGSTMSVKGGISGQFGPVSMSSGISAGQGVENSASLENAMSNKLMLSYTWNTTLVADNQRVIGRSYWGPLGDLFLLLKNPWFSIVGDEDGDLSLTGCERTALETEILIVPAHRLLRPGDDPVASQIPEDTRRRLLELDPFITNLHLFFPDQPAQPLSLAAAPYRDPSDGGTYGNANRASLVARYGISNGVELDLSRAEGIRVSDQRTTANTYMSEVTNRSSGFVDLGLFFSAITLGLSGSSYTGKFVKTSFHQSRELMMGSVKTALCKLIRNQNQADLEDIEVYWDKHFSTFMFRKVRSPSTGHERRVGSIFGRVRDRRGTGLRQVLVALVLVERALAKYVDILRPILDELGWDPAESDVATLISILVDRGVDLSTVAAQLPESVGARTVTNGLGSFAFRNLAPGTYVVQAGDQAKSVVLSREDIEAGRFPHVELGHTRRLLDLRASALWELEEVFGLSGEAARRIQLALHRDPGADPDSFAALLAEEGVSSSTLSDRVVVRVPDERAVGGKVELSGWVRDKQGAPFPHTPVMLLSTAAVEEVEATFTRRWPRVQLPRIIASMPPGTVFETRADGRGWYTIRNLRADSYQLLSGDQRVEIVVTREQVARGAHIRRDVSAVVVPFRPRHMSVLELKHALGTNAVNALQLHTALRDKRQLTQASFEELLEGRGLSPERLSERFRVEL
jgi:hypothetical protein